MSRLFLPDLWQYIFYFFLVRRYQSNQNYLFNFAVFFFFFFFMFFLMLQVSECKKSFDLKPFLFCFDSCDFFFS